MININNVIVMINDFLNSITNERDFPYYNNNPKISKTGWLTLLFSVPISLIGYFLIGNYSEFIGGIVFCSLMLIPLLYFSNWNYKLIFHKLTRKEIYLAILLFMGYIIYAMIISSFLELSGVHLPSDDGSLAVSVEMIISLIFSIMGEELLKFIPLMFLMRFFYKYSERRDVSLVFSSVIVLMGFGLLHYNGSIISVLLLQGLGSIFELYGYIKTKNLFVPYLTHLLTDVLLMSTMLLF